MFRLMCNYLQPNNITCQPHVSQWEDDWSQTLVDWVARYPGKRQDRCQVWDVRCLSGT